MSVGPSGKDNRTGEGPSHFPVGLTLTRRNALGTRTSRCSPRTFQGPVPVQPFLSFPSTPPCTVTITHVSAEITGKGDSNMKGLRNSVPLTLTGISRRLILSRNALVSGKRGMLIPDLRLSGKWFSSLTNTHGFRISLVFEGLYRNPCSFQAASLWCLFWRQPAPCYLTSNP